MRSEAALKMVGFRVDPSEKTGLRQTVASGIASNPNLDFGWASAYVRLLTVGFRVYPQGVKISFATGGLPSTR